LDGLGDRALVSKQAKHVPTLTINGSQIGSILTHGMAKQLRRASSRLDHDRVRHTFAVLTYPALIDRILPELEAIHLRRDHQARVTSDIDDALSLTRWRQLAAGFNARGELIMALLRCNGEIAGYVLAVAEPGVLRVLDGHCSPSWLRYSPGRMIEAALIHWAFRHEITTIDWMSDIAPEAIIASNGYEAWTTWDVALT
jgi:hypothetical protein